MLIRKILTSLVLVLGLTSCSSTGVQPEDLDTFNKAVVYGVKQFHSVVDTANVMIDGGILVPETQRYNTIKGILNSAYEALLQTQAALLLEDMITAQDKFALFENLILQARKQLMESQQHVKGRTCSEGVGCNRYNTVWA